MTIDEIAPRECFRWFTEIAKIPHCSHDEKRISDFLVTFAQERGLEHVQDAVGNVLIKKAADKGMETAPTVILQAHMDMVCVKRDGLEHDFSCDPLTLRLDGDLLTADGTTLGADNGIGIAMILALLDAKNIPHPALEAVITIEEEVGMKGASSFDASQLSGTFFINADSEGEGVFTISCAGGRNTTVRLPVMTTPTNATQGIGGCYIVSVSGLSGGHSGLEIDKQRGNAIRIMGRVLDALSGKFACTLASISGGSAANVIPSSCSATVSIDAEQESLQAELDRLRAMLAHELAAADGADLAITTVKADTPSSLFTEETTAKVLAALLLLPDGVTAMDLGITSQRLVESSSNIGVVATENGAVVFSCLSRSSVNSKKELLYRQICTVARLIGAETTYSGDYPAWEMNPHSRLIPIFQKAFTSLYGKETKVESMHAGLECGLFYEKFNNLGRKVDFISFGPNITGAHTVNEAVSVSSVANTWALLQEVLRHITG